MATTVLVGEVTIEKAFPKVRGGDECEGRIITNGAERLGLIARVFEFKDVGLARASYRNIVKGYRFENWIAETEEEFPTLAEALAAARRAFRREVNTDGVGLEQLNPVGLR